MPRHEHIVPEHALVNWPIEPKDDIAFGAMPVVRTDSGSPDHGNFDFEATDTATDESAVGLEPLISQQFVHAGQVWVPQQDKVGRIDSAALAMPPAKDSAGTPSNHAAALDSTGYMASDEPAPPRLDAAALRTDAHYRLSRLPQMYSVYNDVTLPSDNGRLHFDQLVVAVTGVFIISFMPIGGSVYGDGTGPNWVVVPYGVPVTADEAWACASGASRSVPAGAVLVSNPASRNGWLADGAAQMMGLPRQMFHCATLVGPTARLYVKDAGTVITTNLEESWIRSIARPALEEEYVRQLTAALSDYLGD